MVQTVEQIVRETKEAMAAFMRKLDTPAKKRRMLRELGILKEPPKAGEKTTIARKSKRAKRAG